MNTPELEARKRALRLQATAHAERDREPQAARCLDALLALPALAGPGSLSLYCAIGDEVPVERISDTLRERGFRTLYPRVAGAELVLHEASPDELVPGRMGLREPPQAFPRVEPEHVDVFLVPGLLFGRDGSRLGRGRAYYDRLLARARRDALRIGICYADRVRDALPTAPHDAPVHLLVTDQAVLRCRASVDPEEFR